ncbi:DNA polymerase III subunit gamma/tau [Candidatus Saccharibacteria bacterium]|nr:DNA polymerase III subunit gamma/tau [Candidatus Saccharibacteria bacterium]
MGQALYRKYRSKSLDEIVGQSHITTILSRAIAADKIAHAYLLTGPRGVGKTSIARILAHEINKLPYNEESTHLDIIEIDAASNNGVEDIRDLREKVQITPVSARKKVYIIDEVHMLSKQAFNALLKTLEEPPEHVVFILATTDVEKLPATIISRVQRFNFRSIAEPDAVQHLRIIADLEKIDIDDGALRLIARQSNGSFRDSISLLDQLSSISDSQINQQLVAHMLGLASTDVLRDLMSAYESRDLAKVVQLITDSEANGTPAIVITEQLIRSIREQIIEKPYLLTLLDALLDVAKSSWPYIKLLSALTRDFDVVTHQPTPVATNASTLPAKTSPRPAVADKPKKPVPPVQSNTLATIPDEFPWGALLEAIKEPSIGAYALLSKCTHAYDGATLTVYAGRSFQKNKLEKSRPEIQAAMHSVGADGKELDILAKSKPASDSQTAAVLDIMGGGEEVTL